MTRKKKWSQLTKFVTDLNQVLEHYHQFRLYEAKSFIKALKKSNKVALFIKNKPGEELSQGDRKRLFSKFFGR